MNRIANNQLSFLVLTLLMIFTCCEKDNDDPASDLLLFPVGRSFLNTSVMDIRIGDHKYNSDFVFDSCGGYWLQLSKSDLPDNVNIVIAFTRKKADLELFSENVQNKATWIHPSYYIDSDNEAIVVKAGELTNGLSSPVEKAKAIQQFVIAHLKMKVYKDSFLEKASTTYELGYGTCMNFSRLFVALCRAAEIPARTIWGVVYGHNDDQIYDYHHQWAEIMDNSGCWHPADFNYTTSFDLNDVRYLDLIYAAEENTLIKNRALYDFMLDDLKYYNNYPVTLTAHLGFELTHDNRPDSMTVEFNYER